MVKTPEKPEDIFLDMINDFRGAFGADLMAIILYGSSARGEYIAGTSDINFLVVLSPEGIRSLDRAFGVVSRWRKRKVPTPLFMTREYIESSLDSYPIEFLNISLHHRVVCGEDFLSGLKIDHGCLRLQCERELKGKLLLLRTRFLETEGKEKALRELIGASITAFISIFRALLHLRGVEVPERDDDVIRAAAGACSFSADVFLACLETKKKAGHAHDVRALFGKYVGEIDKICTLAECM